MRLKSALLASGLVIAVAACATAVIVETENSAAGPTRPAAIPMQAGNTYYGKAAAAVESRIEARGMKPAKNVILFIGDGMGISTITAGRIYAGQKRGLDGESYRLTMETLPYSALSKTYSDDFQVSDSAATASAMVTGVKTKSRFLGVTAEANYNNCASVDGAGTDSLFDLAERAGLATGIVSTARITHATPASTYSEVPNRDWESDQALKGADADGCADIARQLIEWPEGDGFEIAMGGGRSGFLTAEQADPEDADATGGRGDGRDLMAEWAAKSADHVVLTGQADFEAQDFASDARILGLFEASHMEYELDRAADTAGEPSLAEMTRAAITRLSRNEGGYVLMVEGGRIDHGHHAVNAARALEETDQLDLALAAALEMTDPEETLIILTADHSHTMTLAGYPRRGNPILGLASASLDGAPLKGIDGKPYTTLGYMNGVSACRSVEGELDCSREDLSGVDTQDKDFKQPALVPMYSETHGGEDVAIFATGPGANLISGVMEQNEIFHVMGRASGLVAAPGAERPAGVAKQP